VSVTGYEESQPLWKSLASSCTSHPPITFLAGCSSSRIVRPQERRCLALTPAQSLALRYELAPAAAAAAAAAAPGHQQPCPAATDLVLHYYSRRGMHTTSPPADLITSRVASETCGVEVLYYTPSPSCTVSRLGGYSTMLYVRLADAMSIRGSHRSVFPRVGQYRDAWWF
jgi:hypothetical protein